LKNAVWESASMPLATEERLSSVKIRYPCELVLANQVCTHIGGLWGPVTCNFGVLRKAYSPAGAGQEMQFARPT
jgi:hypothetical protein